MSDIWDGAYWDENGVLHLDICPIQPVKQDEEDKTDEKDKTDEDEKSKEDSEEFEDEEEAEHTYATIDCGGECGGCIALIVDGVVVSGPPFHQHCGCSLRLEDIESAEQHKSNLHNEVASDRNADPRDVEWLKKSLEELDCYEPDTRAGESAGNPNPYPNQKLFDAIEKFRKLQKIKERGGVKPGHWTEVKINQELEKKKQESVSEDTPTFETPVNTKPGQYAVFDGNKFTLYENDKLIMSWDAVSGKDGYRSPEFQNLKDTGPIPEGTYVARQSELQHITLPDAVLGVAAIVGEQIGSWPGSYYSWGESRVWLEPSKETNTYGRDDFSIHGGWNLGSAGCIDMTGQINAFTSWLESTGKDLIVHVKY